MKNLIKAIVILLFITTSAYAASWHKMTLEETGQDVQVLLDEGGYTGFFIMYIGEEPGYGGPFFLVGPDESHLGCGWDIEYCQRTGLRRWNILKDFQNK